VLAEHRLGPPGSEEGAAIAHFSSDGRHLLVGTTTGRLHVLDARTLVPARAPIRVFPQEGESQSRPIVSFNPSGDGRTACRFCGAALAFTVVDLGMSPLCESFVAADQLVEMEPFYPLHVRACEQCWRAQLPAFVKPVEISTLERTLNSARGDDDPA
jgi:hypothetical protein